MWVLYHPEKLGAGNVHENLWLLQIVITYPEKRPKMALPYSFTEQALAMLSGVLKSEKAINVNIAIMRVFILINKYVLSHKNLTDKLKELETKNIFVALSCLANQKLIAAE